MKKNKLKIISLIFALATVFESVLAATATFYGEVTDDGGDPELLVWFEYGEKLPLSQETPKQQKNGRGEFSATVSGLEDCTTYYYRAVAQHKNYNDKTYGEIKSFTTPCLVSVDLRVNNSSSDSVTISYSQRTILLSWTSQNANSCFAQTTQKPTGSNINWSGTKATFGSEHLTLDKPGVYEFHLSCTSSATGNSNYDRVQVILQAPTLSVITRGVVVTY